MPRWSAPVFDAAIVVAVALATAFGRQGASNATPRSEGPPKTSAAAAPKAPVPASEKLALVLDPQASKGKRLVIVAGGDVNFGRECGQEMLANPAYDPFQFVAPLWRDADLTFVNLESQLSDQKGETQSPRNRLIFTGPPGGADVLARAGIDVVSTANNHAWDYGRSALFETIDNLARAGVANVGTGKSFGDAYAPAVLNAQGYSV